MVKNRNGKLHKLFDVRIFAERARRSIAFEFRDLSSGRQLQDGVMLSTYCPVVRL